MNNKHTKPRFFTGFTLVEFSLVMVVLGLIVGGVLRAQELITSARVRNIIDQKASIETAMVAFTNRYKATPGDLTNAQRDFIGSSVAASTSGAGNGIVALTANPVTNESVLFFQNLTATGFLTCSTCLQANAYAISSVANSPVNVFGAYLQFGLVTANATGTSWLDRTVPAPPGRNILTTGSQIGSNVLREIDVKADDGAPATGIFRQSSTGGALAAANCAPAAAPAPNTWLNPPQANCAGAWLF